MKKIPIIVIAFFGVGLFQYCSSSKKAAKAPAPLSYTKDISPILQTSCTPCHFPPDGKKEPLNSYDAVVNHLDEMIARVKLPTSDIKFMPFKLKKPALSDTAINALLLWKSQGMGK